MGKECMARLSRRLWGGTSLKTAAKEATFLAALIIISCASPKWVAKGGLKSQFNP